MSELSIAARLARWACGLAALVSAACGQAEDELGSVMLAISTDMYVDKDLSRVDIVVQPETGPMQTTQVNLFPELEGKFLPGTFSIVEGSTPGELVRVRVIARRDNLVRVVREAALKVPRRRTALLSMPIQWLCDGEVRPDGQLYRSDCPDDYTCVAGTCEPAAVDETTLPDYEPEQVFGGGGPTGDGSCFDTLPCFETAFEPPLDLERCVLDVPAESDLNVAVALPPGGDGHCADGECLIPLDKSELTGWRSADGGGGVQLPSGVCRRVVQGMARVQASNDCPAKYPGTPTCGPWTIVGSPPGGDPVVVDPTPPVVSTDLVISELTDAVQRILGDAATACGTLAQSSPPDSPTDADVRELCSQAMTLVAPLTPLSWHHVPARCWPDAERQLECESQCAPTCDVGSVAGRCEFGAVTGSCDGTCESRRCLGGDDTPVSCPGACAGTCSGACEGNCMGQCDGECDFENPDGYCDGFCLGVCTGLCEGRCEGTCQGHCDGDPNLGSAFCEGLCQGSCSSTLRDAKCDGPLGQSTCPGMDFECADYCRSVAHFKLQCDHATAWVMPKPGLTQDMVTAIGSSVPELVSIRDLQGFVVEEQAQYLLQTMTQPGSGASIEQVEAVRAALDSLSEIAYDTTSLLASLGDERGWYQGGPGPAPNVSCDVVGSDGGGALIDDFEDADHLTLVDDGRNGEWYLVHDGTGDMGPSEPLVPDAGGPGPSTRALHVWGSGFTEWGAALGLNFRAGGSPYDASSYSGIRFWARGNNQLRMVFMQQDLDPGHPCSSCDYLVEECGSFYATEVFLSDTWTLFDIPWSSLIRNPPVGPSQNPPFGSDQLLTLQFEAPAPAAFDFWIDDVELY